MPKRLAAALERAFASFPGDIYELRMIGGREIFAVTSSGIRFLTADGSLCAAPGAGALTVWEDDLEELVDRAIGYSGFAHEEELKQCFLTRPDGTRIGIAFAGGAGCLRTGQVRSLNIRLPVDVSFVSVPALDRLLRNMAGGLLIAGAPNTGKTTLLRYCCRYLGGGAGGTYRKVCVVDERMELAGGVGGFDLGACTDVIAGRSKHEGVMTALRLFSPEVIVCDEIGSQEETESILEGLNSGVLFIASMHANDLSQLVRRGQFVRLFRENVFSNVAFVSGREKGRIGAVYSEKEVRDEIHGCVGAGRGGAVGVVLDEYEEKATCEAVC